MVFPSSSWKPEWGTLDSRSADKPLHPGGDQKRDECVAVKVIKNKPQFFQQAKVEMEILTGDRFKSLPQVRVKASKGEL